MSYPIRRIALLCSLSAGVLLTLLVVILAASGSVTAASEATATAKKLLPLTSLPMSPGLPVFRPPQQG